MGDGFAWMVPLVQGGFGILFVMAHRAGAALEARHWAVGFLLSAFAFAASLLADLFAGPALPIAADLGFAGAFYFFGSALVARYGWRDWPNARRALLAAGAIAPIAGIAVIRTLRAEILGSDLGCAAQILLPLILLVRWPDRWADRMLIVLSWLVVATNLCRTLTAPLPGGPAFPLFGSTAYSYLMYADAMVTGCAFAVLALVVVVAEVLARYRRVADVDPLTGLLNRRGFEAATAAAGSGGVVSCDLDHFKRVNDAYGHAVGDRVLTTFCDLVRTVLPPDAVAARLGGEEFVLYLPGASPSQSEGIAVQIRRRMAAHDWRALGIAWQQSASFGVVVHRHGASSLADAIGEADAQLYEAKRRGRDRVQAAPSHDRAGAVLSFELGGACADVARRRRRALRPRFASG